MGKYKKRKDGRYTTSIIVNGKKKYIYGKTIAEVDMKLSQIKTDSSRGTYADDKGMTVKDWLDKWLNTYKSNVVESTFANYKRVCEVYSADIHNKRLKDVIKTDIQEILNKHSGHYETQRYILIVLRSAFRTAIDDGLIYKDITYGIKLPKKPKSSTRALTEAEKNAIEKCDFTTEEWCFVCLIRYTGMRPEEVRALTINDIDFRKKEISVSKALAFGKNAGIIKEPKTDSGVRTIPILAPLESILRDFISEVDNLYLFTQRNGNLHTKATYRRFWDKIFNKINAEMGGTNDQYKRITENGQKKRKLVKGIKATNLHPYVFRHEFATILYYSGIDIKEAARILGHSDTRMILEVYAELDKAKSNSTDKLNDYLKGAK